MGVSVEITTFPPEIEVGQAGDRINQFATEAAHVLRGEHEHCQQKGASNGHEQRGEKAPRSACIKVGKAEGTLGNLILDQARDKEAANDKEHINADIPARKRRKSRMKQQHAHNSYGA